MGRNIATLRQTTREGQQLQGNVESALRPIADKAILEGRLITGIRVTSGSETKVPHKLGRKWRGAFQVRGSVYGFAAAYPSGDDTKFLGVRSGTTGTYDFWVF